MAKKNKTPPELARRVGGRLTALRRAAAEKIRADIRENGRSYKPKDPPLVNAADLLPMGKKRGVKSKYKPEYAKFAAEMCRLGATDIEVARGLGISLSCLWRWQGEHEAFFRAFLEGKDYCDDRVERALYHRAVGYSYPDLHISMHEGSPVVVPYIKHIIPDVGAASRWLKSRRKEKWADNQEISLKGDDAFAEMWKAISTGQILPVLKGESTAGDDTGIDSGDGTEDVGAETDRD